MKQKTTSYRSARGRALGLGSAKDGTHHWWAQRLTALALVPLTIWFVICILGLIGGDYAQAKAWIAAPWNAVLLLLLIGATFHHAQLGLQVVIEDYVHREGTKFALVILVKFAAILLGALAGFSVLKIAFGG
ncbi:MAG: succinate dehydrogenase, hydrophobic membrane anchor protein [Alphaproteobacteria bacterium]